MNLTPEQIEKYSKLMAEFEGWESGRYAHLTGRLHQGHGPTEVSISKDALQYHTDWNWLHRVWEKFRDLLVDNESNQWQHAIKCRRVAEKLTWHYSLEEAFLELGKAIEWCQTIKK